MKAIGDHLVKLLSEADRTQLPYFQAFILGTKNWIIYLFMDPIFLTDGIEVPSVMKEKKPIPFPFFWVSPRFTTKLRVCYEVLADGLLVLGVQRSLPT